MNIKYIYINIYITNENKYIYIIFNYNNIL